MRALHKCALTPICARKRRFGGTHSRCKRRKTAAEGYRVLDASSLPRRWLRDSGLGAQSLQRFLVAIAHRQTVRHRALVPFDLAVEEDDAVLVNRVQATSVSDDVPEHHVAADREGEELLGEAEAGGRVEPHRDERVDVGASCLVRQSFPALCPCTVEAVEGVVSPPLLLVDSVEARRARNPSAPVGASALELHHVHPVVALARLPARDVVRVEAAQRRRLEQQRRRRHHPRRLIERRAQAPPACAAARD
mmetsp:Transcript_7426/g.17344  ORF Transcript_7426/g.17344 Transcript_7426/m.17344 type:complete len:250 (-) Transcript_7426:621-1370(-)